jgi:hypothetical protein
MPNVPTKQKIIANETLVASATTTSLLIVVAVLVRDVGVVAIHSIVVILSGCLRLFGIFIVIQIHLCRTKRNIGVELVVQPMNLLM